MSDLKSVITCNREVSHENTDDTTLIRRIQAGDEAAFRLLVDRYQLKVFRTVRGILGMSNEIEDIAQQVFSKLYVSLPKFDFRCGLYTWVYKITINQCYDYLRKKRVRNIVSESETLLGDGSVIDSLENVRDPSTLPDSALVHRDLANLLLEKLSEQDRSLIMLREVEGHTLEELTTMTGLNKNTIKKKLFRIRQRMLVTAGKLMHPQPPLLGSKVGAPSRARRA